VRTLALLAVLVLGASGCATAGDETVLVELEGRVTAVTAGSADGGYVIDVPDKGLLPLDVSGVRPPLNARGVIVEIPGDVTLPDDAAGRFDALAEWVADSGLSLVVVDYLTP
jgi:hypothetical protein